MSTHTPKFKTTLPFEGFVGEQTYRAKGRNTINADAIVVEWWPEVRGERGFVTLAARVKSTQGEHHAWMSMPADAEYLRWLAAQLEWIGEQLEDQSKENEEENSQ